ncbi:MAG TPA: sulfatase/phosphatase domain-containing protein, partial [Pirellulales bacterium]
MTDNGGTVGVPVFNAGMRGHKTMLYDGGHRVPCFIRWPGGGLGAPRDIGELTEAQDILPTLAELCDLKIPSGARIDGTSLAGVLRGTQPKLADRMLVVQYSRMGPQRPAHGDAAVLWKKWRLVHNELYDVAADPGQAQDVAGQHADVVAKLRDHYDRWWTEVEPTVNDFSAITVGSDAENPTLLSPADWADVFFDQSQQVREGLARNGHWNIQIDRRGDYVIHLRRWPVEAHLPIAAGDRPRPVADVPPDAGPPGGLIPGKALPIVRARLRLRETGGSAEHSAGVNATDEEVAFQLQLDPGRAELQTWFYDAQDKELCGAYYVYVERK